jgi:SAM (Sterile alpha motif) domain-containing protein
MQQIADWLKTLGMSEYAERFAESDIDTSVLRDLTDQDLKELGVSLGHRRKMLRAIAELAGAVQTPQAASTEPKPQETAERRQVTVMFSDLVGSTARSARIDPVGARWKRLGVFIVFRAFIGFLHDIAPSAQRFGDAGKPCLFSRRKTVHMVTDFIERRPHFEKKPCALLLVCVLYQLLHCCPSFWGERMRMMLPFTRLTC